MARGGSKCDCPPAMVSASRSSFFFFQAEDGIRDYKVTGVQTCALPISVGNPPAAKGVQPELLPAGFLERVPFDAPHGLFRGGKRGAADVLVGVAEADRKSVV